ncbi:MAG: biotin--[acetyl-CoA-carboxylase] ligase [Actinomycetota bacterium]|nr:biotin--[acetyl-CoA-carboxylase] ligase [Actinomycetota bacterium]
MATPYVLVELGTVASTQREARSRFDGSPVLVTAQRQTAGRGRLGRSWVDAPRAVAASLCLAPGWPVAAFGVIPLIAGLAAREAVGDAVLLKWPNDLVMDGRKVGGILAEAEGGVVTVGIGINLWWPDPMEGAGAVLASDPGIDAPGWIAEQWADSLLGRMAAGPENWGRPAYEAACATLGREITWLPDGSGTAAGIAADGGLVVSTSAGEEVLRSGEVGEVRPKA